MNIETNDTEQPLLFSDLDLIESRTASMGQRFLNLLIDIVAFYVLNIAFDFIFIAVARDSAMDYLNAIQSSRLFAMLVGSLFLIIYYFVCEKAFRGKTLGKLITGTKAVRDDGTELTVKDAFLRSLSRIVPFEFFSGFAYAPWHDKWTNTTVIKTRL